MPLSLVTARGDAADSDAPAGTPIPRLAIGEEVRLCLADTFLFVGPDATWSDVGEAGAVPDAADGSSSIDVTGGGGDADGDGAGASDTKGSSDAAGKNSGAHASVAGAGAGGGNRQTQAEAAAASTGAVLKGCGALFVTTQRVLWLNNDESSADARGFEIDYPYISMHGLCRDPATFPMHCVYCQLDVPGSEDEDEDEDEDEGLADGDAVGDAGVARGVGDDCAPRRVRDPLATVWEVRIAPPPADVEDCFRVMSECSALHPCGDDNDDDDGGDSDGGWHGMNIGDMMFAANISSDAPVAMREQGDSKAKADAEAAAAVAAHLESVLHVSPEVEAEAAARAAAAATEGVGADGFPEGAADDPDL